MQTIVFTGPSLSSQQASSYLQAHYLGPAQQGDIYKATLFKPDTIVLIDGYFQTIPAVWHKEILYAIKQGIWVLGAASMGALRAAELIDFGMQGVGKIFTDYANGRQEDDDEVAVTHAPEALQYQPTSEALINMRYTINQAQQQQIISANFAEKFLSCAKSTFYPQRHYSSLLTQLSQQPTLLAEVSSLQDYLNQDQAINQKQLDAIAALKIVSQQHRSTVDITNYPFHHTDAWENLTLQVKQQMKMIEENI